MIYFSQEKAYIAFAQVGKKFWENKLMYEMHGTGETSKSHEKAVDAKFFLQ